jgi:hypothetical protein
VTDRATYNLIFNAVGALIGITVICYVAWSFFQTERKEPCRARYPAPTRFSLATSAGAPLSPIELQGRAGVGEWGVLDNSKVVTVDQAPGTALEVKLAPVPSELAQSERDTNGIDFRWTPLGMKAATAACLDYSVFVPEKFPFNEGGGVLPAVVGGAPPPANSEKPDRFSVRLEWTEEGKGVLSAATAGLDFRAVNLTGFPLEPGHWMRVQQEVVLNTPGAADGIVRLWADGDLMAEDTGIELRKNKDDGIIGVLADIGYVRQPPAAPGSLQFSPFEISWR